LLKIKIMGLIGAYVQYHGQKKANETNIQLAREAQKHDLNMWNLANEYNSPANQMSRFKDAGLNPNLMYGQGSPGNAQGHPQAFRPEVRSELANFQLPSLIELAHSIVDLTNKQKTGLVLDEDRQLKYMKGKEAEDKARLYGEQSYIAMYQKHILQETYKSTIEKLKHEAKYARTHAEREEAYLRITQAEAELAEALKAQGVGVGDHIIARIMAMIMSNLGVNMANWDKMK
jgi:hypothetical protein